MKFPFRPHLSLFDWDSACTFVPSNIDLSKIYNLSPAKFEKKHQALKIKLQRMKKGVIKLSSLAIGKSAVITSFEKDDLHIKLMEMGCVPGETVKVEKIAPLGDPISIMVAGYNLSLRKTEADFIWVEEVV
ncbi:Fe2+ transport system protein FeoA [Chitinophaga sp. CF418]|nr:Fe2+ transport system protein FeoA [Chitinophaga sp. CF418]